MKDPLQCAAFPAGDYVQRRYAPSTPRRPAAGLIDHYGLSDAVIERHEEMQVKLIPTRAFAPAKLSYCKSISRKR
jgi:hypothetical protein